MSLARYQDIIHSINLTRKDKVGLDVPDEDTELLKFLRSDIQEIASRLLKGGLGYFDDDKDIEDQVSRRCMVKCLYVLGVTKDRNVSWRFSVLRNHAP